MRSFQPVPTELRKNRLLKKDSNLIKDGSVDEKKADVSITNSSP